MNSDIPAIRVPAAPAKSGNDHPPHILMIKGDAVNVDSIVGYLDRYGFHVRTRSSLQDGLRDLAARAPDLVILDLHPGRAEGLETLREIRSQSDVPVIIITDTRDDELDRVLSLELGADDCITRPVGLRELVARMRAVLRRRLVVCPAQGPDRGRYRFGGWILDRRHHSLTDPAGSPVGLSKGEYALLVAFLDAPQRPLSRVHLLQATRLHEDIFDRSIDVQVLRLRRKLEQDPSAPRLIRTERGVGYTFTAPVDQLF
jgi:two-component system OmpR family response regulator